MMFKLEKYINDLICECKNIFGERLLYVGLQGSYLRKEAHENSDIDIMVIIVIPVHLAFFRLHK